MVIDLAGRRLSLVAVRLTGLIGFDRIAEPAETVDEPGRLIVTVFVDQLQDCLRSHYASDIAFAYARRGIGCIGLDFELP